MSQNSNTPGQRDKKVVEAEIVDPLEQQRENFGGRDYQRARTRVYGQNWTYMPMDMSGCVSPFVTLFIFLTVLGQYGLLAAIGFFVFYVCGSVIGTFYLTRKLMAGLIANPWPWRIGNWLVSFLLAAWLAGGMDK